MEINEEIYNRIEEYKLDKKEITAYLILLFFDLDLDFIPKYIKIKTFMTGIVSVNEEKLVWNIPLFENQEIYFEWVEKEYMDLYKRLRPELATNSKEATTRMKALFAKRPDIRKEEVLKATEKYLKTEEFPRRPHYFIKKGRGENITQDILTWIEKYRDFIKRYDKKSSDLSNSIQ